MPLILGANSVTGGYEVDNSLRFNVGSSDSLTKTFGAPTNRKIFTISGWFKNCQPDYPSDNGIFSTYTDNDNFAKFGFQGDNNQLRLFSKTSSSTDCDIQLSAMTRDVSAWYHFICAVDTTQATNTNRVKIYVNGVQQSSFVASNYPSLNADLYMNFAIAHQISGWNSTQYFDGYMSEFNFIDGQQLAPSDFGEFDEDSGIWKPIAYTGTYGTNGFYLEFKDSSALGDDTSGNSNDFTVNNLTSIDQTTDTPTNNFCTMNPLDNFFAGSTFTQGNTQVEQPAAKECFNTGTFGVSTGKWYWETKVIVTGSSDDFAGGISDIVATSATSTPPGQTANNYGYNGSNGHIRNNATTVAYGNTYTTNDIVGTYLDLDNNKLYFAKNGTVQNSGTGFSITAPSSTTNGVYFPIVGERHTNSNTLNVNFGNPSFAISTGNTDVNGYGNFEYDPSAGTFDGVSKDFLALCTKNLSDAG